MTPSPQERATVEPEVTLISENERVVISGMSGLYPDSRHVKDLSNILYNKMNPISSENIRWKYNHPEVAQSTGKVPELDRFDAQFFKVHFRLGYSMDAMARKILEQTYQAIYDAGVSPEHLSGKKVGVYIGTCFSETEKACFYVASSRTGFGIAGCSRSMFANRISYWLNAKGPSLSIDEACCSSIAALEQAYLALTRGECEAAIVGGASLCLHPQSSVHYGRIMKLSMDGKTKSFDQNADGCAKSEAINVLFLQKAKDALRIYADVMYVKSEFTSVMTDETGPRYGCYRDPESVVTFLNSFYKEANVPPKQVQYVEAFGSAVPEADKAELEAISEVFCKNRQDPLLVGSVMSNIGYGEGASGISAVTKVLLAYQNGKLAANLHCANPRQDIPALKEGRMKIVTEHAAFDRNYTAVNGISVTGVNAHVLLRGRHRPKDLNRYKASIPQLVTISGRQESGVRKILADLKTRPVDPEELALFRNIHEARISGHMGRGYIVMDTDENGKPVVLSEKVDYFDDAKRPLWFVYSGMGSQWPGMGLQLMKIPVFAAAIEKCRRVLQPKGVDIVKILTSPDKTMFDNILHSFVGIAAVQIGLTDVLKEMGIVPDKIIGHSVGELGCAYADGCFTAEEMILSAYSRGLVSVQTPFIRGSMAAVGIGYQEVKNLCPPEIEVACHNASESSTISGPAEVMKQFVAELTAKGVFAKEVPCSNIAYHSRYIAEAGPGLLQYLREVIKTPKPRSDRWVSTSVPQDRWDEPAAKYSSAEYHTNNLLNPVLFEETSVLIPSNAVLVEIAPHGLLQAILKRSLPDTCKHIPMTRRGHADNTHMVLEAIGKIYMEGYNPKIAALYPKVEFPVSTGTPMLNHLVEWAHNEKWPLPLYVSAFRKVAASAQFIISLHDEEHKYLQGHVVRGKNTYPFAACLTACWDTLAMSLGAEKKQLSVQFTDVKFFAQPITHDRRQLRLSVALHRGTGRFEIMDEDSKVATGYVVGQLPNLSAEFGKEFHSDDALVLGEDEVYQLLSERDYAYKGAFRSIHTTNGSFTNAQIKWSDNWATFIDGVLQLSALKVPHDGVAQPALIRRLCIDVKTQAERLVKVNDKTVAVANVFDEHDFVRCGGVIVENMKFTNLPAMKEDEVALKSLRFFPRFQSGSIDVSTSLQIYLQLVAENISKDIVNVVGIPTLGVDSKVYNAIANVIEEVPKITVNYEQMEKEKILDERDHFLTEADLVVVQNLSMDDNLCQSLYRVLRRDTFILNIEQKDIETKTPSRPSGLYRIVSCYETNQMKLELSKWRPTAPSAATTAVSVRNQDDIELLKGTRNDLPSRQKLIIFSSYPTPTGLKELVKKWRGEADKNQVYLYTFNEQDAANIFDQLPELDLAFNTLHQGMWGGEFFVPSTAPLQGETRVTLQSSRVNDLDSLHWVEAPEVTSSGIPVQVHFAGLNDLDAKRASGVVEFKQDRELGATYYGMDFSGVTRNGDRVMGIVHGGAASNKVHAIPELLWPVPRHWSLEDAVTVPLPYAHAFYCLAIKVRLHHGMKILVHGGTGALGQALISIALANGCEVFATVSSLRKKKFLKRLFPELKEDYIGNSRDISFGDMVMKHTDGMGVNVVVTSQQGEMKNVSLKCCGSSGIILDTLQLLTREHYDFGMHSLTLERNYLPIDFSSIIQHRNKDEITRIQYLMVEGIRRGYVRPLSRVTYAAAEAARALRLLNSAQHRGRAILHVRGHVCEVPRMVCSPQSIQVVITDEKPFGIQVCDRLVSRGAKNLAICSKTETNYLKYKVRNWQKQGVRVILTCEVLKTEQKVTSILHGASQIAPIEAVFVVSEDDEKDDVLRALDNVTRKMVGIKHFVVVGSDSGFGQEIALQRANNKLAASSIDLPYVQQGPEPTNIKQCVSWRNALDSIERGIRSSEPVVTVVTKPGPKKTLLEEILEKAEVTLPTSVRDTATLEELGLQTYKVPSIAAFLQVEHNIALNEELIQSLTIQKIKALQEIISAAEFEAVTGLGNFFNYVDPDEMLATTEMVFLPTLTSSAAMRDDEFDVTQAYLCIVPGLEGHHERFRTLCERLKLPALVLQAGLDRLEETPKDMAARFAENLLKKVELKHKNTFYLLGYETGVIVALEIAAILEDHGLTGTVYCVGASPQEMKTLVEQQVKSFETEDSLKEGVLRHMFKLMGGGNTSELDAALENTSAWEDKLHVCIRTLLGRVAHSAQYAKMLIEAAYARLKIAADYKIVPRKLKSKLVLLQAATENPTPNALQDFSELPITVSHLKAPLAQTALDLRCTAVINNHLNADILEAFENRNLCESYLLNADTFMTNSNDLENSE